MNSVIMWQTISRLSFLILITSCDSGLAQDAPRTPEPNSQERKAIIKTLRAPVGNELEQKVVPEHRQGEWIRVMKRQVLLMPAWTACYSSADSNPTRLYRFHLPLIADCWRRILVRRWESL